MTIRPILLLSIVTALAFACLPACSPIDDAALQVTGVVASGISGNSAVVTWVTDKPSIGQVEYGNTSQYSSTTPFETQPGSRHTASLSGLSENTTYHYRVKSRDQNGNDSVSADYMFDTKVTISVWFEDPKIRGLTLQRPPKWSNSFQPSADVLVFLADSEKCSDFEPQISILRKIYPTGTDTSIANLLERSKSANKLNNKYEFISEKQMPVNGLPAGEITWKVAGKNIEAEQWVFISHENNVFIFYCLSAYSCRDRSKQVFDDIISSFKLVMK
jgi:hypothetical protein